MQYWQWITYSLLETKSPMVLNVLPFIGLSQQSQKFKEHLATWNKIETQQEPHWHLPPTRVFSLSFDVVVSQNKSIIATICINEKGTLLFA